MKALSGIVFVAAALLLNPAAVELAAAEELPPPSPALRLPAETSFHRYSFHGHLPELEKDLQAEAARHLPANQPYTLDATQLEKLRLAVNSLLQKAGYVYSQLHHADLVDGELRLNIHMRPVKKIFLKGRLASAELAAFLGIIKGQAYNLLRVEEANRRLKDHPVYRRIRKVYLTPYFVRGDGLYIEIDVKSRVVNNVALTGAHDRRLGSLLEFKYSRPRFLDTEEAFLFSSSVNSNFSELNRLQVMAGMTDLESSQKAAMRYKLTARVDSLRNGILRDIDPNLDYPLRAGNLFGIYYRRSDTAWRNLSRLLGFHGAPLVSGIESDVLWNHYTRFALVMSVDDRAHQLYAYKDSRFGLAAGLLARPGGSYLPFTQLNVDYFVSVTTGQFARLQGTAAAGEAADTPEGWYLSHHYSYDYVFLPGREFALAALKYYFRLFSFFHAGPGSVLRYQSGRFFPEAGLQSVYSFDDIDFQAAVGYIFAPDGLLNRGGAGASISMTWLF